jgi:hypothetical protein
MSALFIVVTSDEVRRRLGRYTNSKAAAEIRREGQTVADRLVPAPLVGRSTPETGAPGGVSVQAAVIYRLVG